MERPTSLSKLLPLLFCTVFFISACGGGSGSESGPTGPNLVSTQDYKLAELDFIDAELRALHPDLFFQKSEHEYELDLAEFRDNSEVMTNTEFRLEMAKFIAGIGDQHTYITMPFTQMKKFPVKIWWAEDRAIVIEADRQHEDLLGQEMISIDGTPVSFIKDPAMQYLAHENEYWKDALSPQYLHMAAILQHEGFTASADMATFVFEDINGNETTLDIESRVVIDDWIRIEYTHASPPLYSLYDRNYAYHVDGELLYIQYNSAFDLAGYPLWSFIEDIESELENEAITKVAVDVRFNYGGIIDHFVPVIDALARSRLNAPDSLFVLTGRNSFSSAIGAIYSFETMTEATFVGGPTGGKPNGFSNVIGYSLPGSGNALYMSTQFKQDTPEDVDSFYPEHQVFFTQQDFISGQDPVLNFVRSY